MARLANAGIPRTADGKPNLTAPAPRTSDGKPDLSGLWQPEVNPYRFDVIQDPKDEAIFRPAAEAIFMERLVDFRRDDPVTNCLPGGPSEILNADVPDHPVAHGRGAVVTRVAPAVTGRSIWMGGSCRKIRTRPGWGTRSATGRATRW